MANTTKCGYVEHGFGQVEPNHLSAQRTAQIYAQLPMGVDMLENGQFAKYNYEAGVVNFAGESEWMLVYNAVKIYRDEETEADFVMVKPAGNAKAPIVGVSTDVVPRLFKTNVGDIFTTNAIKEDTVSVGDILAPNAEGILSAEGDTAAMKWQVVKTYTMPDGQKGVKLVRIA